MSQYQGGLITANWDGESADIAVPHMGLIPPWRDSPFLVRGASLRHAAEWARQAAAELTAAADAISAAV